MTSSIPIEDAYLVAYRIEDCIEHELGSTAKAPAGFVSSLARRPSMSGRDPTSLIRETSNCMMYYLPESAMDVTAEEPGKRFGELDMRSDKPADDPVIAALSTTLMPAFANPEYASQLFLDHTTLAVANHIAQRYGGLNAVASPSLPIFDIALACGCADQSHLPHLLPHWRHLAWCVAQARLGG